MFISLYVLFILFYTSFGKLCCDVDCRRPMSYGRTNNRHIAEPQKIGDTNFLSFAQGSLVQVFAKDIGKDGQYWEAEITGRRGLIEKRFVAEQHVMCSDPQHHYPDPEEVKPHKDTREGPPGEDTREGPPGEDTREGPPGEDTREGPPGEDTREGPPGEDTREGPPDGDIEGAGDRPLSDVEQNPQQTDQAQPTMELTPTSIHQEQVSGGEVVMDDNHREQVGVDSQEVKHDSHQKSDRYDRHQEEAEDDNHQKIMKDDSHQELFKDNNYEGKGENGGQRVVEDSYQEPLEKVDHQEGKQAGHEATGMPGGLEGDHPPNSREGEQVDQGPGQGGEDRSIEEAMEKLAEEDEDGEYDDVEDDDEDVDDNDTEEDEEDETDGEGEGIVNSSERGDDHDPSKEDLSAVREVGGESPQEPTNDQPQHSLQVPPVPSLVVEEVVAPEDGDDQETVEIESTSVPSVDEPLDASPHPLHVNEDEVREPVHNPHSPEQTNSVESESGLSDGDGGGRREGDEDGRREGDEERRDDDDGKREDKDHLLLDEEGFHPQHIQQLSNALSSETTPTVSAPPSDTPSLPVANLPEGSHPSEGHQSLEDLASSPSRLEELRRANNRKNMLRRHEREGEFQEREEQKRRLREQELQRYRERRAQEEEERRTQEEEERRAQEEEERRAQEEEERRAQEEEERRTQEEKERRNQEKEEKRVHEEVPSTDESVKMKDVSPDEDSGTRTQPHPGKRILSVSTDERPSGDSDDAEDRHKMLESGDSMEDGVYGSLLSFVPQSLREVIEVQLNSRGAMGVVYGVLATLLSLMIPNCVFCCSWRSQRKSNTKIIGQERAAKKHLTEQLEAAQEEKTKLSNMFQSETTLRTAAEQKLLTEQKAMAELSKEKSGMARSIDSLKEALSSTRSQLETTKASLNATTTSLHQEMNKVQTTEQQLSTVTTAQQLTETRVAELKAANDQLELDLYNGQQTIQQLQLDFSEIKSQHAVLQESHGAVSARLSEEQEAKQVLQVSLEDKEKEVELLQACLRQVVPEGEETDLGGDGPGSEGDGTNDMLLKQKQIEKIHAMLDTSKAQLELRGIKQEKDKLEEYVRAEIEYKQQLEGKVELLERDLQQVTVEKDSVADQLRVTQGKLQTLTEYFEQKEHSLHKKLGLEEYARREFEGREATAKEKVMLNDQEREREREEMKLLRKQMVDVERNLTEQVVTNQQRAQEAFAQLQRREQELRAANKEITALKKSLHEAEMEIEDLSRPKSPPRFPFGLPLPPPPGSFDGPVPIRPHPLNRPPSGGPKPHLLNRPPSGGPQRTSSPMEEIGNKANSIAGDVPPVRRPPARRPEFVDRPLPPPAGPPRWPYRPPPPPNREPYQPRDRPPSGPPRSSEPSPAPYVRPPGPPTQFSGQPPQFSGPLTQFSGPPHPQWYPPPPSQQQ